MAAKKPKPRKQPKTASNPKGAGRKPTGAVIKRYHQRDRQHAYYLRIRTDASATGSRSERSVRAGTTYVQPTGATRSWA